MNTSTQTDGHQDDDEPGKRLADPGADAVDRVEENFGLSLSAARRWRSLAATKHHPVVRANGAWPFQLSSDRLLRVRHRSSGRTPCVRLTTVSCSHCVARSANAICDWMISLNSGFVRAVFLARRRRRSRAALQDRIRRLVELDLVLGLQLDVVLASSGRSPSRTCPARRLRRRSR